MSENNTATFTPRVEHSSAALKAAEVAQAAVAAWRRRLDVHIHVEAEAADDSPLSKLVANAVKEFASQAPSATAGKFESRDGLDVSWRVMNRYYADEQLIGMSGVNDRGELVNTPLGEILQPGPIKHPVPLEVAHMDGEGVIVIDGVRFQRDVFKTLANPDPAKRYVFTKQGDVVTVVERA